MTCSELLPGKGYSVGGYWIDSIQIRARKPGVGRPMLRRARNTNVRTRTATIPRGPSVDGLFGNTIELKKDLNAVAVHQLITCDVTGQKPIIGRRYKKKGWDYDLCHEAFIKLAPEFQSQYLCIEHEWDYEGPIAIERCACDDSELWIIFQVKIWCRYSQTFK